MSFTTDSKNQCNYSAQRRCERSESSCYTFPCGASQNGFEFATLTSFIATRLLRYARNDVGLNSYKSIKIEKEKALKQNANSSAFANVLNA